METIEFSVDSTYNIAVDGLGSIIYDKWYSRKGHVTAGSSQYVLQQRGFWGTHHELLQNNMPVYETKMSFWGKLTITPIKAAHHFYTITYKGFKGYRLLNYKGEEVATLGSDMRRKGWKTIYTLNTVDGFTATDEGKLLSLLLIRQYRGAQQATVAAATTS